MDKIWNLGIWAVLMAAGMIMVCTIKHVNDARGWIGTVLMMLGAGALSVFLKGFMSEKLAYIIGGFVGLGSGYYGLHRIDVIEKEWRKKREEYENRFIKY